MGRLIKNLLVNSNILWIDPTNNFMCLPALAS